MSEGQGHHPDSLREFFQLKAEGLSSEDLETLKQVAVIESKEQIHGISEEVGKMNSNFFSIDAYAQVRALIDEYSELLGPDGIQDSSLREYIWNLRNLLDRKNPIAPITNEHDGYVLVHSSNLKSLERLLATKNDFAEVCVAASTLLGDKNSLFTSKSKELEAGLVFSPANATDWFSKDVGSHTQQGKRVLESRFEQYRCADLKDAVSKQGESRIEAWVDARQHRPAAILLLDTNRKQDVQELGKHYQLPVVFNSSFFEPSA